MGRGEPSGYGVGLWTGGPGCDSRCRQRPCDVRARKIHGSESPSVGSSLPWVLSLEKISFPFKDIQKLWKWMVLPSNVVRQKSDSCYCNNRPPTSGVTYTLRL